MTWREWRDGLELGLAAVGVLSVFGALWYLAFRLAGWR
jgi:hypothetical protein